LGGKSIRTKFKENIFGILTFTGEVEEEKHTQQNYTDDRTFLNEGSRVFSIYSRLNRAIVNFLPALCLPEITVMLCLTGIDTFQ